MRPDVSFAVIGLGDWGTEVAEALEDVAGADLRALCDANADVVTRLGKRYPRAGVTRSLDDVLHGAGAEAVVVALPLPARRVVARLALASGLHVFVRAPPASTGEGMDRLAVLAGRSPRRLVVGDQGLENPALRRIFAMVESGDLGDVHFVQAEWHRPGPAPSQDILLTLGLDQLTTVLALLREDPVAISGHGLATADGDALDVVGCHVRFASGIAADLRMSRIGHREVRQLTIVGSERSATYDALGRTVTIYEPPAGDGSRARGIGYPDAGTVLTLRFGDARPLVCELESFVAAVRGDGDVVGDVREVARSRRVIDALRALMDEATDESRPPPVASPSSPAGEDVRGPGPFGGEYRRGPSEPGPE